MVSILTEPANGIETQHRLLRGQKDFDGFHARDSGKSVLHMLGTFGAIHALDGKFKDAHGNGVASSLDGTAYGPLST